MFRHRELPSERLQGREKSGLSEDMKLQPGQGVELMKGKGLKMNEVTDLVYLFVSILELWNPLF